MMFIFSEEQSKRIRKISSECIATQVSANLEPEGVSIRMCFNLISQEWEATVESGKQHFDLGAVEFSDECSA